MPLIRRFAVDPEARGNVTAYYELKNSVDSIVRTSNMLERTMNYEELPGYLMDNMKMLASKDYILDLEKTMKEFREMKILIRSASMDADAKKEAILAIDQMENQLTSNIQYMKKLAKGD
jgi:septation ring formation regulator EzrA